MSSVAKKLEYLDETKQAIKQALINKGAEVLETDTFRSYAEKVDTLSGGFYPLNYAIHPCCTSILIPTDTMVPAYPSTYNIRIVTTAEASAVAIEEESEL